MTVYCSFCGKSEHDEPIKLIKGPDANICDACIALCVKTLASKPEATQLDRIEQMVGGLYKQFKKREKRIPQTLRSEFQKISEGFSRAELSHLTEKQQCDRPAKCEACSLTGPAPASLVPSAIAPALGASK